MQAPFAHVRHYNLSFIQALFTHVGQYNLSFIQAPFAHVRHYNLSLIQAPFAHVRQYNISFIQAPFAHGNVFLISSWIIYPLQCVTLSAWEPSLSSPRSERIQNNQIAVDTLHNLYIRMKRKWLSKSFN